MKANEILQRLTNRIYELRRRGRKCDRGDLTIAVLVEQAEGLLELGDLIVGELLRHASSAIVLTREGWRERLEILEQQLEEERETKKRTRAFCALSLRGDRFHPVKSLITGRYLLLFHQHPSLSHKIT